MSRCSGLLVCAISASLLATNAAAVPKPSASSDDDRSAPENAMDGERFSVGSAWRGAPKQTYWWWQVDFGESRPIASILQIQGSDELVLKNAPRNYVWEFSQDGREWTEIPETRIRNERRQFRLHRLASVRHARFMRIWIDDARGDSPALREVEFSAAPAIDFPKWVIAVSTTERHEGPGGLGAGQDFIPLVRSIDEWKHTPAQWIWMGDFDEEIVRAEPRPMCAFLSGNFVDFCQKEREAWRGIAEVMNHGHLPMWGACGGAQGLAILADSGVDVEWDCPHCRNPSRPKTPIYGHIGHTDKRPCGDYSCCLDERGKFRVLQVREDPVFEGVDREFEIMESHCGQIEYPPQDWVQIATKGNMARTNMQCIRMSDRPIYAAQFHIEMQGTPENSRRIMENFLKLSAEWGGFNPAAKPLPVPKLIGEISAATK